ncbi:hypothetical protein R6Z07M_005361 [Ovis aries]
MRPGAARGSRPSAEAEEVVMRRDRRSAQAAVSGNTRNMLEGSDWRERNRGKLPTGKNRGGGRTDAPRGRGDAGREGSGAASSRDLGRRVLREDKGSQREAGQGARGAALDRRLRAQTRGPGVAGSSPQAAAAEAAAGFPRPDGQHRVNPRRAGARFPGQRRQFRRAGSYHRARAGERGGRGRGGAESSGSGPDAPGAAAARPGSAPRARSVPAGAAPRADAGAESAPARGPPAGAAECGRPAGSFEKRARTKAAAASRRPARARSPARAAPEDAAGDAAAAAGRRGPGAAGLSPARAGPRGRPPGM